MKTVSFGRRTDILSVYTVSGKAIENVDKCKEVTVDSRFKFDDQTDIKIKKASPMLGISKRKFNLFDSTHFVIRPSFAPT